MRKISLLRLRISAEDYLEGHAGPTFRKIKIFL